MGLEQLVQPVRPGAKETEERVARLGVQGLTDWKGLLVLLGLLVVKVTLALLGSLGLLDPWVRQAVQVREVLQVPLVPLVLVDWRVILDLVVLLVKQDVLDR